MKKGRVVHVSFADENSPETEIWMFRIMERIILDQLNIHPIVKSELLFANQKRITKLIEEKGC
ncbi:hypothetical protein [Calidifontibacillus oryziterrae]|uniref:hypothetical protein n=1 Tax=Calidifontibacillus oryziterrae TaxID=1191699 RepID=UPI0002D87524|nr:hypothetical protein [Calidifontibacillus oryziterrae]